MPPAGYPSNLRNGYIPPRLLHTGTTAPYASTDYTEISPAATTTLYVAELLAPVAFVTTGCAPFHGSATGSASLAVGLFDASGTLLLSVAATAIVGTDAIQQIAWTKEFISTPGVATAIVSPQLLPPGVYFIATVYSTTSTVKIQMHTGVGNFGAGTVTGVYATAFLTTQLTIVPPVTYTSATGPVVSLY